MNLEDINNTIQNHKRVYVSFNELVGKTLVSALGEKGSDLIAFTDTVGDMYVLYHHQDCCESVYVEDIVGDLSDLIGSPILQAEESSSTEQDSITKVNDESFTWSYYKLATINGYVDIRFFGSSNGYYSESVDLIKLIK